MTFRSGFTSVSVVNNRHYSNDSKIKRVTVIGGGLMGSGIVQVAAASGHGVTLVDQSKDLLNEAVARIHNSLARVVKKKFPDNPTEGKDFLDKAVDRISLSTEAEEAVTDCDLVVEAIIENIEIKQKLFSRLDAAAGPGTIFASNTSSLSIAEISTATKRKDKFGGLHFFNPVPMMKLVEVVRTKDISEDAYNSLCAFGKAVGMGFMLQWEFLVS